MKTKTTAKVLGAALLTMTLARTATVYAEEEYTIGDRAVCRAWISGQLQRRVSGRTERGRH